MQVRQLYVNDTQRIRASFCSVGTEDDEYMLVLFFGTNDLSKSIQFELYYDNETNKYVDKNDANVYAEINNDQLELHHKLEDDSFITTTYSIVDKNIINISGANNPNLRVNDVVYTANGKGNFIKYKHSKFINDEGQLITYDNEIDKKCTYVNEIEGIRQYLLQHLAIMKHELWYNYEYGLPLLEKGLSKAMIDAEVLLIIFDCPGIKSIESFDSYIDNYHEYRLSMSILTIYGKLDLIDTL